jgi:predicted Rossmann fold flavoprotein
VLRVLEIELKRLIVPVEFNFEVVDIKASGNGFTVVSKSRKNITCGKVIITGGGKTYPALGSDGNCYRFARQFGHTIIEPVPSGVPIVVKDSLCHFLQGQKIFANATSVIGGKITGESGGEILFTKYGLSGTAILDISRGLSVAVNRHPKEEACVVVDMVPFMSKEQLKKELTRRLNRGIPNDDLLTGILPNKFKLALGDILREKAVDKIIASIKDKVFEVLGTRGWNEAEFTSGGINVNEIKESTLESKLKEGVYFAGEILDVDGERGGYNLAWAWTSGFVAGLTQ